MDPNALRVHRAKNMVDGSVLASAIKRLKTDQQGTFAFAVDHVLQRAELAIELLDVFGSLLFAFVFGSEIGSTFLRMTLQPGLTRNSLEYFIGFPSPDEVCTVLPGVASIKAPFCCCQPPSVDPSIQANRSLSFIIYPFSRPPRQTQPIRTHPD